MGKMLIAQTDSITPQHFLWEKRGTLHVIQWMLLHNLLLQKQGLLTCLSRNQTTNPGAVNSMHYPLSYIVTLCYTGPVLFHRNACPLWVIWGSDILCPSMTYWTCFEWNDLPVSTHKFQNHIWDKQRLVTHLSSVSHSVSKRFSVCGLHQNICEPLSLY